MSLSSKGLLLATIAASSWGAVYAINEITLTRISPAKIMIISGMLDLIILPLLIYWKGEGVHGVLEIDRKTFLLIGAAAVLGFVANYCILSSIQSLGASLAAVLEITYPIFTIIILSLFLSNRIDLRFGVGACLVMIGIAVIVSAPGGDVEEITVAAELHEEELTQELLPSSDPDFTEYDAAA